MENLLMYRSKKKRYVFSSQNDEEKEDERYGLLLKSCFDSVSNCFPEESGSPYFGDR